MVAIDTNILVRYYINDVPVLAKQAQDIIDQAVPRSLFLDRLIIAELTYVLKKLYKFAKLDIVDILQSLIDDEHFVIGDREIANVAIKIYKEENPLSFEDCWLLALMKQHKVKSVATFDKDLKKRVTSAM